MGKYISGSENNKGCKLKCLRSQAHRNRVKPVRCKTIGNSEDCGKLERVCSIERDQTFLVSIDCYLDLVFFQKKLEILNVANELYDAIITKISWDRSKSIQQIVIYIRTLRERERYK